MMRWSCYISLLLFSWNAAFAQCSDERYAYRLFVDHFVTSDLHYGHNLAFDGIREDLYLDVYEPMGDGAYDRPLIILAHGGSLVFGAKSAPEMVQLGSDLARMGFVVASIEYRKGIEGLQEGELDSTVVMEANLRAVQDMRAAIRFFKHDAAELGNTFRIDTTKIVIGGISAGAIVALHTAYLDQAAEIPSYVDLSKPGLAGGIEGHSGHPHYRSQGLRGVISICGAILDTAFMEVDNIPVFSMHGNRDQVVPYYSDTIWLLGLVPLITVDGSSSVHMRAEHLGLEHCLYTLNGADHATTWDVIKYADTAETLVRNFMRTLFCDETLICAYNGSTEAYRSLVQEVVVYPNPSVGTVYIKSSCDVRAVSVIDLQGRLIQQIHQPGTPIQKYRSDLMLQDLPKGMYLVKVETNCGVSSHPLVVGP